MVRDYSRRTKNIHYEAWPSGLRALGLDKAMQKASGQAASAVVSAANTLDPKGEYSAKGIGVYAGHNNEPRHGAVVEGEWHPGARTGALLRAMAQVAKGTK